MAGHDVQAIAHYLIERELGRGAMGVVYLAHDTKLGRPVAIKSLPADLANDIVRRQRFEQEARTLAQINHPNIGSIYGLEQQDGSTYLILEFAEGPTLSERLANSPPGLEESLEICRQMALGIEAAHQRGIIHRDLKPENIKIRPDGVVKVLDFGIAMAGEVMSTSVSPEAGTVVMAPKASMQTRTGFIMGTPGYMSPEQARGRAVSHATDTWALGCILYEVLSHRQAFPGESLADALAVTLLTEPDLSLLPPKTPGRVIEVLRQSLQKDYRKRGDTVSFFAQGLELALRDLAGGGSRVSVSLEGDDEGPAAPGNLAPDASPLFGRSSDIAMGLQVFGSSRLLTLTGAEGSGRSRLARAIAQAAVGQDPSAWHSTWVARLPALGDASLPAISVATLLGAKAEPDAMRAIAGRIAARKVLLVLDNCQFAPTACAGLVHDLMGACPNLRVIAVARGGLGIGGEKTLVVGPLTGASDEMKTAGARLFIDRFTGGNPGYAPDAKTISAIAGIVRALSGWPLAIEIAAGLASVMEVTELHAHLDQRLRLQGLAGVENQPAEQLNRMMVDWALDIMPPAELAMILQASAFVTPCGIRALLAAGGARDVIPNPASDDPSGGSVTQREIRALNFIPRLVSRGLLRYDGRIEDAPSLRLWLPEPVRRGAIEKLRETPAAVTAVMQGHRGYFLASAEQACQRLGGSGGGAWLARLENELAELVNAQLAAGTDPAAARLGEFVAQFKQVRGFGGA